MKKVGLGLVGCGVVGGGVVSNLKTNRDLLAERSGIDLQIRKAAVRDTSKDRGLPAEALTTNWLDVVNDPKVDLVVELMGGTTTSKEVVETALKLGKPVITANKALLADFGEELFGLAEEKSAPIYFEASVAGGIPIVKALQEGLRANKILNIHGIINGTCNYILTRMENEKRGFEEILKEAKELGYAEADESLDVDGIDAAHKAALLASIAYGFWVKLDHVYTEGIRDIQLDDIDFAKKLGYRVKLLATIKVNNEGAVETRVHPTLVPLSHVMASIGGVYNAVAVEGDVVGETLFYGRGAGADPTASAVLSDIIEAAMNVVSENKGKVFAEHNLYGKVVTMDEVETRYYIHLNVEDRPGVLAQISRIFADHQIGISSVLQPEGDHSESIPLIMFLDFAKESNFRSAVAEIETLEVVKGQARFIRVEDFS